MAKSRQRKCLNYDKFFDADRRNTDRQRYCSEPDCRRAAHPGFNRVPRKGIALQETHRPNQGPLGTHKA